MASELSPDRDVIVDQLVATGCYPDRRRALDHAVDLLREETEAAEAIREGLASISRGEGRPLEEAARELSSTFAV